MTIRLANRQSERLSTRPRLIGMLGFEGANAQDIVGPLEAFATARLEPNDVHGPYQICLAGLTDRPFTSESGVRFAPDCTLDQAPGFDTLIVPGGPGVRVRETNAALVKWLHAKVPRIRRVASVCTGIYALAAAGFLDGRRATTHWRFVADVARRFPRVRLSGDELFIQDGRFYTSGGITAGIDLALALIEQDHGARVALDVARELVMYLKRSGGQNQFSTPLRFQTRSVEGLTGLVAWIYAHLHTDLSTPLLAARSGLSVRQFSRRFNAAMDSTPAAFVETARLAEARERLIDTPFTIDMVARSVGFHSADVFRRRFEQHFGITPKAYRQRFMPARITRGMPLRKLSHTGNTR